MVREWEPLSFLRRMYKLSGLSCNGNVILVKKSKKEKKKKDNSKKIAQRNVSKFSS